MSFKRDMKIQDIYQKIKNDVSDEVKNSDAIDYYGIIKVEQNFLINEIAKLRLEIEELRERK
jgi:hypothetical protein